MNNYNPNDLKSTLQYIKRNYGYEIFTKQGELLAVFSDLAPNLKNERVMLERMSRSGILKDFVLYTGKSKQEQERVISKAMTQLTQSQYIMPDIAATYLSILISVFGWNISIANPNNQPSRDTNRLLNNLKLILGTAAVVSFLCCGGAFIVFGNMGKEDSKGNEATAMSQEANNTIENEKKDVVSTDNKTTVDKQESSETDLGEGANKTEQSESELSNENADTLKKESIEVDTITTQTSVGDYVYYGTYEQNNNLEDGNEWIEWLVLDEKDSKYLLITSDVIDCVCYNNEWKVTTWENCSLRDWLNTSFITEAFTEEQKDSIAYSDHEDEDGNYATDQVFILNPEELRDYFKSNEARTAGATPYAKAQGVYVYSNGNCWWWVSEAGADPHYARYVNCEGAILEYGMLVFNNAFGVRPAIWVYK